MKKVTCALFAAAALLPVAAQAAIQLTTTGLASYDQLVDFSSPLLAPNTVVTNQYAALGLVFTPTAGGAVRANSCGLNAWDGFRPSLNGATLNTYGPGCDLNLVDDSFSMKFANDVSAASFGLGSYRANLQNVFTALLDGIIVDTFVHSPNTDTSATDFIAYNYLTFSNMVFDEIRFTETASAPRGGYLVFDNVAYRNASAVPEPATAALFGLGFLGFAAARRRKR